MLTKRVTKCTSLCIFLIQCSSLFSVSFFYLFDLHKFFILCSDFHCSLSKAKSVSITSIRLDAVPLDKYRISRMSPHNSEAEGGRERAITSSTPDSRRRRLMWKVSLVAVNKPFRRNVVSELRELPAVLSEPTPAPYVTQMYGGLFISLFFNRNSNSWLREGHGNWTAVSHREQKDDSASLPRGLTTHYFSQPWDLIYRITSRRRFLCTRGLCILSLIRRRCTPPQRAIVNRDKYS